MILTRMFCTTRAVVLVACLLSLASPSFASLLIEQGAHPKYIQEQMGHSSIQVTMDTYGHLFPNRNRGLVDRLDMTEVESESAPQSYPEEKVVNLTLHKSAKVMVRPEGLEPPTPRSVVWCSIH